MIRVTYSIVVLMLAMVLSYSCKEDLPSVDTMDEDIAEEDAYFADYAASDMKFGYINTAGKLAILDKYDGVREFSEGLAAVNYEGKWGYIDRRGQVIIDFQYRSAFAFKEGIARIQDFDKRYWYIDDNDNRIFEESFEESYDCQNGIIRVKTDIGYNFMNLNGDTLLPGYISNAKDFQYGLAVVKQDGFEGVLDTSGEYIIPNEFDKVNVYEQVIKVKKDGLYGIYNHAGRMITEPMYNQISPFQQGLGVVSIDGQLYMINTKNEKQFDLPEVVLRAEPAMNNLWRVYSEEGVGLMNKDGQIITDSNFDQIFNYSEGLAGFAQNDKWGYLDEYGEVVIPAQYDLIWDFKDGRARVIADRGIGFIDNSGIMVIKPIFFEVKDFEEGLARVQIYRG